MSNIIIARPEKATTTRYLVGNQQEVFHALKCAKGMKTGGYFDGEHLHVTIQKTTKEYGRLVIDYTFNEDFVQPVYTVYSAVGSWSRYSRLTAVTEAKEILRKGESTWATIVCPNGYEIHFNLHEGDVGLMLYGSNPEYEELSKALDALQWL